jgi:peptidoglycan/LPS O-acetylase OafA/YrhL
VNGQERARLDSLTGLRFLAAFAVFGFHATYLTAGPVSDALRIVFGRGGSGVGLFFVLSGFVLAWSARPSDTAFAVWHRRAARILPSYLVTWLLAGAAAAWLTGSTPWRAGAANLLLVQAWIPHESIYFGWNGPAWSLSCEAFFYLLLPCVLPRLARLSARGRVRMASALVALDVVLAVVASVSTPRETSVLDSQFGFVGWLVYICPLGRLPEFVIGLLAALLIRDGQLPRVRLPTALGALAAAYAATYASAHFVVQVAILVVPFALLVVALAQHELADGRSWLARRRWVVLGEWSYAFYLTHHLLLQIAQRAVGQVGSSLAVPWVTLLLAAAVLVAAGLFRFVERPSERRLRAGPTRAMLAVDAPRVEPSYLWVSGSSDVKAAVSAADASPPQLGSDIP